MHDSLIVPAAFLIAVAPPWYLLFRFVTGADKERAAHRTECRALLQRIGVPVPFADPTPDVPAPQPKGRWLVDDEGTNPIFIPEDE